MAHFSRVTAASRQQRQPAHTEFKRSLGCRDGPTGKITGCSSRISSLDSQNSHEGSRLFRIPVLEIQYPLQASGTRDASGAPTSMQVELLCMSNKKKLKIRTLLCVMTIQLSPQLSNGSGPKSHLLTCLPHTDVTRAYCLCSQ